MWPTIQKRTIKKSKCLSKGRTYFAAISMPKFINKYCINKHFIHFFFAVRFIWFYAMTRWEFHYRWRYLLSQSIDNRQSYNDRTFLVLRKFGALRLWCRVLLRRVKRTRSEETNTEILAIWNMPMDMHKNVSVQVDSDFALLLPSGVYEIKKMEPRSKIRTIIVFCLFLAIAGIIGFGYFCQDQVCDKRTFNR